MKDNNYKTEGIMYIIGAFAVIWLSLLIAPYLSGGLPNLIAAGVLTIIAIPTTITIIKIAINV